MITKRTVFLLGAGANVPYGFSTGGGLIDKLRGVYPQKLMGNAGQQITRAESDAFREALADNLLPSIDAMLEHRADLMRVGKRVMATLLYQQEAAAGPRSFEEDWMSLIFERMAEGAGTLEVFAQNPVSFVTFNYDRYLEHRFMRGLVARYKVSARSAWEKISAMFIHLYGSLGDLPEQVPPDSNNGRAVPLGAPDTGETYILGLALPVAENAIRIVHDSADAPESFTEAGKRFKAAEQAFFLGFGFGQKNVERLQTDLIPAAVQVMCTTYGMTNAEVIDLVHPAFGQNHPPSKLNAGVFAATGSSSIRLFLRDRIQCFR